ncbi:MAG: peptide ABC transporter substrate-binding protein [Chloroflexota bacterium]
MLRKLSTKILSVGIAAAFAGGAFATASYTTSASSARHTTHASMATIRLGTLTTVTSAPNIDPSQVGSDYQINMETLIHAGLLVLGTDNKIHKDLALSVKSSKDLKTFTFTMRPGLRFSNGDKITAADVVFSVKRALAPAAASPTAMTYDGLILGATEYNAGKATTLPGIKALNSSTVQVKLTQSTPFFLKTFSYATNFVLDPKVESGHSSGPNNNYMTTTCSANVGAGPFKFDCLGNAAGHGFYVGGRTPSYTVVPNKYYWGPKPHVKVFMPEIATTDTAYREFLSGQIDESAIPTTNLATAKKTKAYHFSKSTDITYIAPNTQAAPFNDVNCRLALAYSINRNAIVKVLHNAPTALYTVLPPGFLGHISGHPKGVPYFNPTLAKKYLSKCPSKSTPVKYTYNTGSSDADHLAAVIVANMQATGFNAKVNGISVTDWENDISHPESQSGLQATRYGWIEDYPDSQDYMDNLFTSTAAENIMGWKNAKFDALVNKADFYHGKNVTTTRSNLYKQAQAILLKQAAAVPYDSGPYYTLINPKVKGLGIYISYDEIFPANIMDWSHVSVS